MRKTTAAAPAAVAAKPFSYRQLQMLARIARHLALAENLRTDLAFVLEWLADDCALHRGVITLLNESDAELQADITVADISEAKSGKMRYRPGEGVTGKVFAEGRPLYIPDLAHDRNFLDRSGLRKELQGRQLSFFCVPIMYRGLTIGTLSADKEREPAGEAETELAFLCEVAQLLAPFVQRRRLEDRLELWRRAQQPGGAFDKLIGKSDTVMEVRKLITKVAPVPTTVLLTGETGTGKGVVAEAIHLLSPRSTQPFIAVNCGSIPESLLESELFGHEKGSFTGALQRHTGVLERAGKGTVFLDEIGELPLAAQTRLLRVLQTRDFERVGGAETLQFHARIIAATNRDLEQAVNEGRFRADLFYRLNVFPIHLPPLRERGKADIILLVDHFTQLFAREMKKQIFRLDTPAIDMLTAYHWPGNVRELENVIERAVLLADAGVIHGHHLPPSLQMNRYVPQREEKGDFTSLVSNFEIELITEALKDSRGNQTQAAQKLGLTKRIIQYKIKQYSIDFRSFR